MSVVSGQLSCPGPRFAECDLPSSSVVYSKFYPATAVFSGIGILTSGQTALPLLGMAWDFPSSTTV